MIIIICSTVYSIWTIGLNSEPGLNHIIVKRRRIHIFYREARIRRGGGYELCHPRSTAYDNNISRQHIVLSKYETSISRISQGFIWIKYYPYIIIIIIILLSLSTYI